MTFAIAVPFDVCGVERRQGVLAQLLGQKSRSRTRRIMEASWCDRLFLHLPFCPRRWPWCHLSGLSPGGFGCCRRGCGGHVPGTQTIGLSSWPFLQHSHGELFSCWTLFVVGLSIHHSCSRAHPEVRWDTRGCLQPWSLAFGAAGIAWQSRCLNMFSLGTFTCSSVRGWRSLRGMGDSLEWLGWSVGRAHQLPTLSCFQANASGIEELPAWLGY